MTAAAGVLTGLAKLKRQDSARSQNRPIPASPGLGAPAPEAAPRFVSDVCLHQELINLCKLENMR